MTFYSKRVTFVLLFACAAIIVNAQNHKATLDKFEFSKKEVFQHFEKINERIITKDYTGDTLILEIGVKGKCCMDETGDINFNGDTLNLIYGVFAIYGSEDDFPIIEEECEEKCYFQFKYYIKGLENRKYIVLANGNEIELSEHYYKLRDIQFEIVEGDTVNYYDQYGLKHGLHIIRDKEGLEITTRMYDHGRLNERMRDCKYYDNGQVAIESFINKEGEDIKQIEYYENGIIKSCTQIESMLVDFIESKYYNEQGELIRCIRGIK